MTEITWHKTACNLCYVNCGLEAAVEGSGAAAKIVRIRGDKDNPKSQGYLCNKAQAVKDYVHHRDRLTTPLRRRPDGGHEAISWDQAIAEIAERLQGLRERHGGQTLALYGGGGQGNHAGGAYANALMRGLGSRNVFNALSQEKTGDFWVNGHLFGSQTCHTAEDVHDCDLLVVIGANPWLAHGFPNARDQLNTLRKDASRKLVVIDPRRSETADLADLHLAVRPGADAWLMGALLALLQQRGAFDEDFISRHLVDVEPVRAALARIPIARWAAAADITMAELETLAALVESARSMVVRVELGLQQGRHSTLNSYLEKLTYLLTGHFGRRGTNALHSWLQPLWGNARGARFKPTDTEVIAGLLPPNRFAQAVLTDHPDRLRGVIVDSSNPANTTADTLRVTEALEALELLVVVDVAMTETAALAHYVLPAASQYEKCEYTLFNFEYPRNFFHVRAPILPPLAGTLPEPEIYRRLAAELRLLPDETQLQVLRAAAAEEAAAGRVPGAGRYPAAFAALNAEHPQAGAIAPIILYDTLGRHLPEGTGAAAPLWAAAQRTARGQTAAVARALGMDPATPPPVLGQSLFGRLVTGRSGSAFSEHDDVWSLVEHPQGKIKLAIPELLDALGRLPADGEPSDPQWPYVLSAGQRRLQNVNQILRSPEFRQKDPDGALLAHPADIAAHGVAPGGWMRVESARARLVVRVQPDDRLRRGYVVLPHGYGQAYPNEAGERLTCGPRINLLTDSENCDPIAATPYHKHVRVRLAAASASEAESAERASQRIRAQGRAAIADTALAGR